MVPQETTKQQEVQLLLERVRAALKRDAQSEALILAIRYNRLAHATALERYVQ